LHQRGFEPWGFWHGVCYVGLDGVGSWLTLVIFPGLSGQSLSLIWW
jgi:hypothetical protein